jgi:hypothetical protein
VSWLTLAKKHESNAFDGSNGVKLAASLVELSQFAEHSLQLTGESFSLAKLLSENQETRRYHTQLGWTPPGLWPDRGNYLVGRTY